MSDIPLSRLTRRESGYSLQSTLSFSADSDIIHTPLLRQDFSRKTGSSAFLAKKRRLPQGWRFGATLAVIFGSIVLVVNATVLGLLVKRNSSHSAIVPIIIGSCASLKHTSLLVHLAINVASSLLLSGSNFCMQCISAPTRKDLDAAHKVGRWLDIAVPSVRNIRVLGRKRVLLWLFLGLSSIPLHLFYNSTFFLSITHHSQYYVLIASSSFADGAPFFNPFGTQLVSFQNIDGTIQTQNHTFKDNEAHTLTFIQARASQFQRLDSQDCIAAYTQRILPDRSNVILVASNTPQDPTFVARFNNRCQSPNADIIQGGRGIQHTDFSLVYCHQNSSLFTYTRWEAYLPTRADEDTHFDWVCDFRANCSSHYQEIKDNASTWTVSGFNVDHCLSETPESQCSFNAVLILLAVVLVFNAFKIVAMVYTLFALQDKPLITIGDAVESFLVRRDSYTSGKQPLTAEKVRTGAVMDSKTSESLEDPLHSISNKLRWWRSASKARWSTAFSVLLICIATIVCLLVFALYNVKLAGIDTFQEVWELGLGIIDPRTLIHSWAIPTSGESAIILSILVANSPQLILSFIYLIFNSLFTSMSLALEWSNYSQLPRTLRVSHQKGEQRSTYFLQIPYRLGIPVIIFSMVLHWLISQSIFLAKIDDVNEEFRGVSTCGYSIIGIISTLVAGVILAVFSMILGTRTLPSGMPLVGSCSLAIAAACHAPVGTSELRPLKWGPLSMEDSESDEKVGLNGFYNPS
ncbi:hypothetical protein DL96DRAFT_498094 [Flagelloscypha sp. PMI_526]|nr:hypothetical protein DL96DRAFT_498094 [Flagelloscypha sp. PMI_526]